MPRNDKQYAKLADSYSPHSPVFRNCVKAFVIGGAICTLAQAIMNFIKNLGVIEADAATWTCIIMIFLSAAVTGIGWYDDIAKHAGAGTLVPITGFANAVVSPALEYKTEGMITGIAAKMFIISGPVIVYGVLASWICGIISYIIGVVV